MREFLAELLDDETLALMGTRGGEEWLTSGRNAPLRENDIYDLPGLDPESAPELAQHILDRHVRDREKQKEIRRSPEFKSLMKLNRDYWRNCKLPNRTL